MDGRRTPEAMQDGNLYDLDTDPGESRNLWGDSTKADVRSELMDRIQTWLASVEIDPRLLDPDNAGRLF
jgi:hypothetical protein